MSAFVDPARPGAFFLFATFLSTSVCAQEAPSTKSLPETVITASRIETRADEVIGDITVVSRDEIESGSARTLSELIARTAGISMSSNGGLGKSSNVYIRGTESRHALLLVDGVRYGSATLGSPNFDTIPLELVDRIEVLKGPASALYGSDAVGGVIQIFTRKGAVGVHPYVSLSAGEWDRGEVSAGVQGGTELFRYALGAQGLQDGGFSATNSRSAVSRFNADRDGFTQSSGYANLEVEIATGYQARITAKQSDGFNQSDAGASAFNTRTAYAASVYGLDVEAKFNRYWKSQFSYGNSTDLGIYYSSAASTSRFNTTLEQWTWLNTMDLPFAELVAGLDQLSESVSGTTAYPIRGRKTDSYFAGLQRNEGAHAVQSNLRRDQNSQFGGADSWMLGYGYRIQPGLRIKGSLGTSFKAPTFNALYYPGYGDPSLQAEYGRSAELGLDYVLGSTVFSATRYNNRIDNFIVLGRTRAYSIPQASIRGVTYSAKGESGAWSYRAALDVLTATNESTGAKLPRRPGQQLSASIDRDTGAWRYGVSLMAAEETQDDDANTSTNVLGGWGTVDMYARYAIGNKWSLEMRMANLGDKFYQTAYGYNQSGRAAYVTLRWQDR